MYATRQGVMNLRQACAPCPGRIKLRTLPGSCLPKIAPGFNRARVSRSHLGSVARPAGVKDTTQVTQGANETSITFNTAKELDLTRKALKDAMSKMDLLKEQVSVADSLKSQLAEQDAIITKLRSLISSRDQQQAEEVSGDTEVVALQAKLKEVEWRVQQQKQRDAEEEALLQEMLDSRKEKMESLKLQLQEMEKGKQRMEAEVKAAEKEAEEAAEKLSEQQQAYRALEEEVENLRKQTSAVSTQVFRGFGGARAKAFAKGVDANTRQELIKAQDELNELKKSLADKESAIATTLAAVEVLKVNEAEQALQIANAQSEIEALKLKVDEKEEEIKAARLERKEQGGDAKLRAHLKAEIRAREAAVKREQELRAKVEQLGEDREKTSGECERLRGLLVKVEQRNSSQSMALLELENDLKLLQTDVENIAQMKQDMQGMAETLEAKSAEVEQMKNQLRSAIQRESEMHLELVEAHDGMIRLQSMLGDMNITNHELMTNLSELEAEMRQKDRATRNADKKVVEAEELMGELGLRVEELKSELGATEKALKDAGKKLKVAEELESLQLERIQAMLTELEDIKKGTQEHKATTGTELAQARQANAAYTAQIDQLTMELEALKEAVQAIQGNTEDTAELKGDAIFKELGMEDDGNVIELRKMLVSVVEDNKELVATLEASMKQVMDLEAQDTQRVTELSTTYESTNLMSQEIGRLQLELQHHLRAPDANAQAAGEKLVAKKNAELITAISEKEMAEAATEALRRRVASLSREIADAKMATGPKVSSPAQDASYSFDMSASMDSNSIEGDVRELYNQLQEEVSASTSLLNKAEELLRTSKTADLAPAAPVLRVIQEHEQQVVEARNQEHTAKQEVAELRLRLQQVEKSLQKQEKELAESLSSASQSADNSLKTLIQKIQHLSSENLILKSATAEQDQHVGQARRFLQAKLKKLANP